MSCKNLNMHCSTTRVRRHTKLLFNSNIGIFSRSRVEKNKLLLEKIEFTHFKRAHALHTALKVINWQRRSKKGIKICGYTCKYYKYNAIYNKISKTPEIHVNWAS